MRRRPLPATHVQRQNWLWRPRPCHPGPPTAVALGQRECGAKRYWVLGRALRLMEESAGKLTCSAPPTLRLLRGARKRFCPSPVPLSRPVPVPVPFPAPPTLGLGRIARRRCGAPSSGDPRPWGGGVARKNACGAPARPQSWPVRSSSQHDACCLPPAPAPRRHGPLELPRAPPPRRTPAAPPPTPRTACLSRRRRIPAYGGGTSGQDRLQGRSRPGDGSARRRTRRAACPHPTKGGGGGSAVACAPGPAGAQRLQAPCSLWLCTESRAPRRPRAPCASCSALSAFHKCARRQTGGAAGAGQALQEAGRRTGVHAKRPPAIGAVVASSSARGAGASPAATASPTASGAAR